jgi:hypothetical protein
MVELMHVSLLFAPLQASIFTLDFPALLAVVAMSLLLARSTKESSLLNSIVVGAHLLLILFVLFAGACVGMQAAGQSRLMMAM